MDAPLPQYDFVIDGNDPRFDGPPTQRMPGRTFYAAAPPPRRAPARKTARKPAARKTSGKSGSARKRPAIRKGSLLSPYKRALSLLRKNPKDANALSMLKAIRAKRSQKRAKKAAKRKPAKTVAPKRTVAKASGKVKRKTAKKPAKRKGDMVRRVGGKRAAGIVRFMDKHDVIVQGAIVVVGAASVSKIDAMIPYRPLGANVPPSAIALGLSIGGAMVASKYKKPRTKKALVSLSIGLGAGLLTRAITQRSAGGVSGVEGVEETPEV